MQVCAFFAGNGHGLISGGWNPYADAAAFPAAFERRFKEWLVRRRDSKTAPAQPSPAAAPSLLNAAQADLHQRLLLDTVVNDRDLLTRVHVAPVRSIQAYLLHRYAHWSLREGPALLQHFVNLDLITDLGPGVEGQRHQRRRVHSLPELLAADLAAEAWLLVGDPGGGKSTLMQHHELTQAVATLRALAAGEVRPELAIWQRLSEHRAEAGPGGQATPPPSPADWLAGMWQSQYSELPPLAELRGRFRLRWLLDGLNEIQREDDAARQRALADWAAWIGHAPGAATQAPPIFSVRRRDLASGLTPGTRQAALAAWTPEQQRDYCEQRLGPGNPLWPQIEADAALRDLSGNPFQLAAQCELYAALGRPAANRAELMSGLAWLRLRRAHQRHELDAPGLLGREDQRELSDAAHWQQHLLRLPDQGALVATLDAQAQAMHQHGQGVAVSLPCGEVAATLGQRDPALRQAWLDASEHLLLAEAGRDFRFSHHLWQEFFAARGLAGQAPTPQRLALLQPPELEPLQDSVARLGALDPLPGPGATAWEEAFKLAMLLCPEAVRERWLGDTLAVNLALAGRAAAAVAPHLSAALLARLKQQLLARSRDAGVDLRLRIEAAEALGLLGDDIRYETRSAGATAVRLPRAGHWLPVPARTYRIGSKPGEPGAGARESPVTPVVLPAFEMAFAPVTHAEFEHFIEAGGYEDEHWWAWQGDDAMTWRREGLRNEVYEKELRANRDEFRRDFNAAKAARSSWLTPAYEEGWMRPIADLSDAQFEREVERLCGARAPEGRPLFWHDTAFNQALQPVVGVSWYEARAYAAWLTQAIGDTHRYALPSEAQWEAAARGTERHRWPWGGGDPADPWLLNSAAAHLRRTSPVGCFPHADRRRSAGAAGFSLSLVDLAGNVWEWCGNDYADYAVGLLNQASTSGASFARALRGGSWSNRAAHARPAYRSGNRPIDRDNDVGFRLVRCPIQSPEH